MMATDPVDVAGLLDAAGDQPWTGMPAGTTIGHLHLHVGDLATATAFYSEALGFDRMVWQYPGALFFGAGGYHHHLGANTWAGRGATPPELGDARLLEWTVLLPGVAALEAVAESLTRSSAPVERGRENEGPPWLVTRDPWGTAIRVRVAAP
jgi:catechol 2,3-dioxygenase